MARALEGVFTTAVRWPAGATAGECGVRVAVRVLSADGGELSAAVNAVAAALAEAGVPQRDVCAACSVLVLQGADGEAAVLADATRDEAQRAPGATVEVAVLCNQRAVVMVQGEQALLPVGAARMAIEAAMVGALQAGASVQTAVRASQGALFALKTKAVAA